MTRKIVNINDLPHQPVSNFNVEFLSVPEIKWDLEQAVIPELILEKYENAFLTPIHHVYVNGKYVPTGLSTPFDDKHLSYWKQKYLYIKFRHFKNVEEHKDTYFWAIDLWSGNYYHWLCESLPRIYDMFLKIPEGVAAIPESFNKYPFVIDSLELLGIKYKWIKTGVSHIFQNLITIQTYPSGGGNIIPALQYQLKNALYLKAGVKISSQGQRKVYISREKAAYRKILNEKELIEVLKDFSYEILFTENLTFREQIQLFAESKCIVALHGAGHTNLMFMPENSWAIEIRSSNWISHPFCFLRLANIFDIRWGYFISPATSDVSNFSDMTVNINLIKSYLSELELKLNL